MLQSARKTKKQPKSYDFDCSLGGATRNRTGDRGVADLCLTAWPWRRIQLTNADANDIRTRIVLERITGLEPATFALARRRSTK